MANKNYKIDRHSKSAAAHIHPFSSSTILVL